jgi:hypothetical protein
VSDYGRFDFFGAAAYTDTMKTCCSLMLVAAALVLGGCGKEQNAPPPSAAPAATPAGYLGTLAKGQQTAVKVIDVTSLNQAIQLFNVQEGRNPKDLNELVTMKYVGALPNPPAGMQLVYDAAQGKASVAPQ